MSFTVTAQIDESDGPSGAPGVGASGTTRRHRYQAFLSYSHKFDSALSATLRTRLQAFAKPWYALRSMHVFRDKSTLTMSQSLWKAIEEALATSEYLVLLASQASAESEWVEREVAYWLEHRSIDTLLIVVTGAPSLPPDMPIDFKWIREHLLPASLRDQFGTEPLYLDLRWSKSEQDLNFRDPRFLDAVATLWAKIKGDEKDRVIGEDVKQHRLLRRLSWSAAVALVALTIGSLAAAVYALWQRDIAIERALIATSMREESRDSQRAILDAARAVAVRFRWGPAYEAEQRLHDALNNSHLRLAITERETVYSSVSWDPTGMRLLTGSRKGATVWDARTGRALLRLPKAGDVRSVAWNSRGGFVFAGGADGSVRSWNASNGEPVWSQTELQSPVASIALSPDGSRLAVGRKDGSAEMRDAATGSQRLSLSKSSESNEQVTSVAWTRDGTRIALARVGDWIDVLNAADGKTLQKIEVEEGAVFAVLTVSWSADGKWLAAGHSEQGAEILTSSGAKDHEFESDGIDAVVQGVAWHPDDLLCAITDTDGIVKIWDQQEKKETLRLSGDEGPIAAVAWSPDGQRIAVAGENGITRIWQIDATGELGTFPGDSFAWGPDSRHLIIARRGDVSVWDITKQVRTFRASADANVMGVAWTRNGQRIAAYTGRTATIWSVPGGKPLHTTAVRPVREHDIASWSPDLSRVATFARTDPPLKIFDTTSGAELRSIDFDNEVTSVAWSADGKRIAIAGGNGSQGHSPGNGRTEIWDVAKGIRLVSGPGDKQGNTESIAWSPDGARLASDGADNTVEIWNATSGKVLFRLSGHAEMRSVAWHPTEQRIATGAADGTISLWDSAAHKELWGFSACSYPIERLAWNHDGTALAALSNHVVYVFAIDVRELMNVARRRVMSDEFPKLKHLW